MRANELLLWLSARRQGTWQQFRNAVEELHLPSEPGEAGNTVASTEVDDLGGFPLQHRLRRNLEVLGHVEFYAAGCENGWRVAPPVLALMEQDGLVTGILCGARSVGLLETVHGAASPAKLEVLSQQEGPDVLWLVGGNSGSFDPVIEQLGVIPQKDASLALLGALPTVVHFVAGRVETDLPLGAELVQRFSVSRLAWQASTRESATSAKRDFFRFRLRNQTLYFVCLGGKAFQVPSEIGKYFLLWRRHRRVMEYRRESRELVVPVICRPPMLLERALILCSGILSRFDASNGTLTYGEIPEVVARLAIQVSCQEG